MKNAPAKNNPISALQVMIPVAELTPHPKNREIYGEGPIEDLAESIRDHGVQDPLHVTMAKVILCGHRRWRAARQLGLESVPCRAVELASDREELEYLLNNNAQRKKPREAMGREAMEWWEILQRRARERQQEGHKRRGRKDLVAALPQDADEGRTRDQVGAKVGLGGKTVEALIQVVVAIDAMDAKGRLEDAQRLRATLEDRGVNPAVELARQLTSPPVEAVEAVDEDDEDDELVPSGPDDHGFAVMLGTLADRPDDVAVLQFQEAMRKLIEQERLADAKDLRESLNTQGMEWVLQRAESLGVLIRPHGEEQEPARGSAADDEPTPARPAARSEPTARTPLPVAATTGGKLGTAPGEYFTIEQWAALSVRERKAVLKGSPVRKMNAQGDNENIEWALWSWNPVTGCLHNCPYCYARDIANRFYEPKFEPSLWPARLSSPLNTPFPQDKIDALAAGDPRRMGLRSVFTCSMADLFGRWVPAEWIELVLDVVRQANQWTFLFLTKFPQRMAEFEFPRNAWVGTTVDCQARVANAEKAFKKIKAGAKWLSCEPLIEPLEFSDLGVFDWIVLGGSSRSSQTPEWHPPIEWVSKLVEDAISHDLRIYMKSNLLVRMREYPFGPPDHDRYEAPEELRYLPSVEGKR